MEKKQEMLRGIENLNEQERLELFKVEELETRLEMAAANLSGSASVAADGSCEVIIVVEVNNGCW
jgi:hypothetical protein